MESLINVNNNQITTTWESFRPASDFENLLPEYTYINAGSLTNRTVSSKFFADLASSSYDATTIKYFKSSQDTQIDVVNEASDNRWGDVPSPDYHASYRYLTEFSAITNMKIYEPLLHSANTEQLPIYIIFKGTDSLWDLYTDVNIVLDHTVSTYFNTFDTEVLGIYNTIKTWIESQSRPVHIIGHSLGAMYGLRLLYLLHNQESPNLDYIEDTYKMSLFNPLIVHNDDVDYFRSVSKRQYSKDYITIHSVKGDFLNPLLSQAGFGTVKSYDTVDDPNTVSATNFLLSTWMTQALGITTRDSYLNADNHSITNFVSVPTDAIALATKQLIESNPLPINLSLQTYSTKSIHQGSSVYVDKALYLYDNELNANSSVNYIDYPHDDTTHESHAYTNYNWGITTPSDIDTFSQYVLSEVTTNAVTTNYINFKLSLTSQTTPIAKVITRFLVKVSPTLYILMTGSYLLPVVTCIKANNNVELLDDAIVCLTDNISTYYDTATQQANKDRFLWAIAAPQVDTIHAGVNDPTHTNNRRVAIPVGNTYQQSDIKWYLYDMNNQTSSETRGHVGYAIISFNGFNMIGTSSGNNIYVVSSNSTVFGTIPTGTTIPSAHIWRIEWIVAENAYKITNSYYPSIELAVNTEPLYSSETPVISPIQYLSPMVRETAWTSPSSWELVGYTNLMGILPKIIYGQYSSFNVSNYYGYASISDSSSQILATRLASSYTATFTFI